MQEGGLLCLPEIDTYCAFRLAKNARRALK